MFAFLCLFMCVWLTVCVRGGRVLFIVFKSYLCTGISLLTLLEPLPLTLTLPIPFTLSLPLPQVNGCKTRDTVEVCSYLDCSMCTKVTSEITNSMEWGSSDILMGLDIRYALPSLFSHQIFVHLLIYIFYYILIVHIFIVINKFIQLLILPLFSTFFTSLFLTFSG